MKTRVYKRLFLGFGSAFAVLMPGLSVARANATMINHALNIKSYKVIKAENTDPEASNYFKSSYSSEAEVKAAGEALVKEVEANGLVLMKNDNNALPLKDNKNVSLFGLGSVGFNYTPSLSGGSVDTSKFKNLKESLEGAGCKVNSTLWDYYKANAGSGRTNSVDGLVKTYKINELSWDTVNAANSSSYAQFNNAAICVFTRDSGEGFDVTTKGSDGRNGMYLGLSNEELNLLKGLTALKKENKFERVIVLLNSSCPIELNFLDDSSIDVDSIMWIGNAGGFGLEAVAEAIVGKINPSGKLSDTYVKEALSSPAMASWAMTESGIFAQEYTNAKTYDLNSTQKYYGAYAEGIYVGYRYYETRFDDSVFNTAKVGSFSYDSDVAYPFGHGLSYTTFSYSDFKVTENKADGTFTVDVTVRNDGAVAGREVVEIYGQKPYISGGVEKSAIELLGYDKTPEIAPNSTAKATVTIRKEQFKSYDNTTSKTYILDEGDYFLTVGHNAHDALKNIHAYKGVEGGDSSLVKVAFHQNALDKTTYSKSTETGKAITNQLDNIDINKYENRGDNSVTYVSRSDWASTFPKEKIVMTLNDKMAKDLESHKEIIEDPDAKEINYASGEQNKLIDLRKLPYDDENWDALLDQMTFEEQALLLTNGAFGTSPIESIQLSGTKASDGPNYVTSTKTNVALPSEGIWASTFDTDILTRIGDFLAEDARVNGLDTLYAPGINIHRTPFIGRSNEYFSEDPVLTGICSMNEIKGMEAKGVISIAKHFAFNDEDAARNGIAIWLNEQAAREIYLLPFEYTLGKTMGNAHGCMSGFNRAGTEWVGAANALQNVIAREEWGYEGYFITDMASSNGALYMTFDDGIMSGTDLYLGAGTKTSLKQWKSSLTFKNKVREAVHRLLYVNVNYSCVMNGIASDTQIVPVTPYWDTALVAANIVCAVAAAASLALAFVFAFVKKN